MESNLYNTTQKGSKEGISVIGIDYEEFEKGNYDKVYVYHSNNVRKDFSSGDVIKDFSEAIDYLHELGYTIICSSSVDDFLMDNDGNYALDNDTLELTKAS
jgi:hypothetical protein